MDSQNKLGIYNMFNFPLNFDVKGTIDQPVFKINDISNESIGNMDIIIKPKNINNKLWMNNKYTIKNNDINSRNMDMSMNVLYNKYNELLGNNSNDYYKYVGGLNIRYEGDDDDSSVNIKLYNISWDNYDLSAISFPITDSNGYTFTDVSKPNTSINVLDDSSITIKYIPYIITNNDTDISLNRLYEISHTNNRDILSNINMFINDLYSKYHEFLGYNSNNDYYKYVGGLNIKHEGAANASSVNIKLYDITWDNYGLSAISFPITDSNGYTFTDVSKPNTSINVLDGSSITIKYIPYMIANNNIDISLNLLYEESIQNISFSNETKNISFMLYDESKDTSDNLYNTNYLIQDISNLLLISQDIGLNGGNGNIDGFYIDEYNNYKYIELFNEIDNREDNIAKEIMWATYFYYKMNLENKRDNEGNVVGTMSRYNILNSWRDFKGNFKYNSVILENYKHFTGLDYIEKQFLIWLKNKSFPNIISKVNDDPFYFSKYRYLEKIRYFYDVSYNFRAMENATCEDIYRTSVYFNELTSDTYSIFKDVIHCMKIDSENNSSYQTPGKIDISNAYLFSNLFENKTALDDVHLLFARKIFNFDFKIVDITTAEDTDYPMLNLNITPAYRFDRYILDFEVDSEGNEIFKNTYEAYFSNNRISTDLNNLIFKEYYFTDSLNHVVYFGKNSTKEVILNEYKHAFDFVYNYYTVIKERNDKLDKMIEAIEESPTPNGSLINEIKQSKKKYLDLKYENTFNEYYFEILKYTDDVIKISDKFIDNFFSFLYTPYNDQIPDDYSSYIPLPIENLTKYSGEEITNVKLQNELNVRHNKKILATNKPIKPYFKYLKEANPNNIEFMNFEFKFKYILSNHLEKNIIDDTNMKNYSFNFNGWNGTLKGSKNIKLLSKRTPNNFIYLLDNKIGVERYGVAFDSWNIIKHSFDNNKSGNAWKVADEEDLNKLKFIKHERNNEGDTEYSKYIEKWGDLTLHNKDYTKISDYLNGAKLRLIPYDWKINGFKYWETSVCNLPYYFTKINDDINYDFKKMNGYDRNYASMVSNTTKKPSGYDKKVKKTQII